MGIIDGERQPRESHSSPAARGRCHRHDDGDHEDRNGCRDGDDDRHGRQANRNQSWAGRLFRTRSRVAGSRREDGDRCDDQRRRDDRRGDWHDGRDRRRRQAAVAPTTLEGSGSSSGAMVRAAEDAPVVPATTAPDGRGRATTRHPSPRSERNHSTDNLTPQVSPPLSPTSVLPSPPSSKHAHDRSAAADAAVSARVMAASPLVTSLCSPARLSLPSPSPTCPPGFAALPTPPIFSDSTPPRTPSAIARAASVHPALEALFLERELALLPTPPSSPAKAPTRRRKTLAGMTITSQGGFSLRRNSARVQARKVGFATSMAKEAQGLVCRSIGIIRDGEDVTARALDQFEQQFKDQLPENIMAALQGLFKIDDTHAASVEEALISHGGAAALDHDEEAPAST